MDMLLLAQEFTTTDTAAAGGILAIVGLFYLAFIALFIAAGWKLFTKAGEDGWKVLVPFYNVYVLLQIIGRPGWWLLLFFVPFVNIVIQIIVAIDVAKSYGKDTAFAIGLIFLAPIFYPILAFGDARYLGPAGPEPRPGYPSLGQGGYGQGGYGQGGYPQAYGAPQGGYQPPAGQQWGQQPQQQWGQQPQWDPQQPQQWGQPPQQPQQWDQQPQQPQWGQPEAPQRQQDYPPPPIG